MIVPDSSAWIEYMRRTESPLNIALRDAIDRRADLAITEIVVAEVLAGSRSDTDLARTRRRLLSLPMLRLGGLAGFEQAGAIYRECRAGGETLRGIIDCLIAVPAIRTGASILHKDRDFDAIARHTDLQIEPV